MAMRYEDLTFAPHPLFGDGHPDTERFIARLRRSLPANYSGTRVEIARITFANGWGLSVIRNNMLTGSPYDYESALLADNELVSDSETGHRTVDELQAEIDRVESLPPRVAR